MSTGDRKPSANSGFLFVNKDAKNIHARGHIGAVNAHVHADARAKKKKQQQQQQQKQQKPCQPQASDTSQQASAHSWTIGKHSNNDNYESSNEHDTNNARADFRLEPVKPRASSSSASSPMSIASLCDSPSTLEESGPDTPEDVPATSLTLQPKTKQSLSRRQGQHQERSVPKQKVPQSVSDVEEAPGLRSAESAISYIGATGLDPFLQLPGDATRAERKLTQYYLSQMGPLVYGTRVDALFCPVRDVTFTNVSKHSLIFQWTIAGSQAHLAARQGLPEPASLLRRKAQIFHQMKESLNHPVERCSEGTFVGVAGAIVVDSRATGPAIARMHLRGLEMLLEYRGGLESFYREDPLTYSVFFFVWTHHVCNGGTVPDLPKLELYMLNFQDTLRDMQSWNRKFRHDLKRLSVRQLWQGDDPIPTPNPTKRGNAPRNFDTTLEAYASSRMRAFSPSSVLRQLINPNFPCSTSVEVTCHYSNLYTLNLTLWTFRENHVAGASFVNRLMKHMNENGTRDPISGMTSLKSTALVWMLRKARVEVDNMGKEGQEREVWMSWKIIHGLKIMALLDDETRNRLVTIMSSWLTVEQLQNQQELSEDDLRSMRQEVIRNWEANPA